MFHATAGCVRPGVAQVHSEWLPILPHMIQFPIPANRHLGLPDYWWYWLLSLPMLRDAPSVFIFRQVPASARPSRQLYEASAAWSMSGLVRCGQSFRRLRPAPKMLCSLRSDAVFAGSYTNSKQFSCVARGQFPFIFGFLTWASQLLENTST
jgi:hypothetical protein